MTMMKRFFALLVVIFIIGAGSACLGEDRLESTYYIVDPRFSDLYDRLDGQVVLGPPISNKKFVAGTNQEKQYFEGAVLIFDPDYSPHYYLDPVGIDAGFSDLPDTDPGNPAVRYLNGFIIPLDFSQFYDKMGGERWVGLPLTRARLNPEKDTIEQYFENMGFFRFADDPPGTVYLMPYGLWKCAGECSKYPGLDNAGVSRTATEVVQSPFGEAISRFGTQFTGDAITSAYRADDGKIEQIFVNVVLTEDQQSPLGVSLRPAASVLDIQLEEYQDQKDNSTDYYRAVDGKKGFYIPSYFIEFIDRYFGFELSGEPISRLEEIREGVFQQCFENYCLLYDALADPGNQVRLLPLGQKYKDTVQQQVTIPEPKPNAQKQQNIQLDIWEQLPQISSLESQQIGACIHDGENPLADINVELIIRIEDQRKKTYPLSVTDSGGCSFLKLEPIQAENGTTVDYQVCFFGVGGQDYCKKDSFLIWGNAEKPLPEASTLSEPDLDQDQEAVKIEAWELYPQISSQETQEIGACAYQNDQPLENLEAQLVIETPNAGVISYQSTPTDGGGCSFFRLEPVNANNGETIPYQVCLTNKYGEHFCTRDSFLIWGNP
jgi:hypothetical protein